VVPVSSSAQLHLLPWLLLRRAGAGPAPPAGHTSLAAALHAGSCAGIAWSLRHDLPDRRTTVLLAASGVPAAVAGLLAADLVEARLGRPGPTAALLAAAGVLMWAADRRPSTVPTVGPRATAAAAVAQVAALAPGVSRAGATRTALRLLQVERRAAERFSLLMSLPVTAGAAAWTLARADRPPSGELAVGVPLAALTSAAASTVLDRRGVHTTTVAALYRLAVAAAVAVRLSRERSP